MNNCKLTTNPTLNLYVSGKEYIIIIIFELVVQQEWHSDLMKTRI